jgi:hypothetical protein
MHFGAVIAAAYDGDNKDADVTIQVQVAVPDVWLDALKQVQIARVINIGGSGFTDIDRCVVELLWDSHGATTYSLRSRF